MQRKENDHTILPHSEVTIILQMTPLIICTLTGPHLRSQVWWCIIRHFTWAAQPALYQVHYKNTNTICAYISDCCVDAKLSPHTEQTIISQMMLLNNVHPTVQCLMTQMCSHVNRHLIWITAINFISCT